MKISSFLLFFVRVHLKSMVLVTFASNFTTATAATTHKMCTLNLFYHLQKKFIPKSNWAGLKKFSD